MEEVRIPAGTQGVGASLHGRGKTAVVLGHGAGGDRRNPFLVALAEAVAASGRCAVLYNFPYSDAGRRGRPDPPAVLEATSAAAAAYARAELGAASVVLGGKSMGGRIASQAVAAGTPAEGLVFLGYPLHPPGRPEVLRDKHLSRVGVPMLFVQGTRDAFAQWDLLAGVLAHLGQAAELVRVEDADHSFAVRKRTGQTAADVEKQIHGAVLDWLQAHGL